jgi:hypothetical protein
VSEKCRAEAMASIPVAHTTCALECDVFSFQPLLVHQIGHEDHASVAKVAARFGFRSSTTFALEYRKRFGLSPSRTKRAMMN